MVITREDLDRFVNAFSPNATGPMRGRMAVQYARTLAFSALAEQLGFDKNPQLAKELELQLRLIRMRILASAFMQTLEEQAPAPTEAEIQKYYETHKTQYEQVQVRRLSIPMEVPNQTGRPLDRAVVKSEIEALRVRALAGEDWSTLQQEAYKQLNIQATPPPVTPVPLEKNAVQGDEAKVFDLKPGEISPVLDLPASVALMRVESKEALPLSSVRPQIESELRASRMEAQLAKLTKKINPQFNLQYLDLPSQPDLFGVSAVGPTVARTAQRRATALKQQAR